MLPSPVLRALAPRPRYARGTQCDTRRCMRSGEKPGSRSFVSGGCFEKKFTSFSRATGKRGEHGRKTENRLHRGKSKCARILDLNLRQVDPRVRRARIRAHRERLTYVRAKPDFASGLPKGSVLYQSKNTGVKTIKFTVRFEFSFNTGVVRFYSA